MQSFFTRMAWFRMEQYILRHSSKRIAISGAYGRTLIVQMACDAMRKHRHVRMGYPVQEEVDIPLGILGSSHEKSYRGLVNFLVGSKEHEIHEREPDTIITELPILKPGFEPSASKKILPNILVLHHIASQRLDLFQNVENIEHEYEEVIKNLGKDAVLVVNADDERAMRIAKLSHLKIVSYGRALSSTIHIGRAVRGEAGQGIFIVLDVDGKQHETFMPNIFAKEHVSALASAVACAHVRGIAVEDALQGIKHTKLSMSALRMQETKRGAIIVSEYVECPEQMIESLKSFTSLPHTGRKIAVLKSIESLGAQTVQFHEQIGLEAAQSALLIISISDGMRSAQRSIDALGKKIDTHWFDTEEQAITWLIPHIKKDDMIYTNTDLVAEMDKLQ
jgi:UDP-N-acetylmuramoyl-tripeptide--D-alanyl-D-alanine ligase